MTTDPSTEERLRFLALMLDAVQQAVIAIDRTGNIIYWNRFAEHLYGWAADEVTGRNIAEVLMPEDQVEMGRAIATQLPRHDRRGGEWRLRRRDGGTVLVLASPTPILDENGQAVGTVGVSWDISDRKRLEEERRQTQEVLQDSQHKLLEVQKIAHVGSWELDLRSGTVVLSEEGARMFFADDQRILTTADELMMLVHPDDRERVQQSRIDISKGGELSDLEFRIMRSGGGVRVMFSRAEMVHDEKGEPLRMIGTAFDVTDRHRVEEELREKSEELKALSRRLFEAQEAERRRLARELHDNCGQLLAAIRLNLEARGSRSDHLAESIALVDQAIEQVRTLAVELRPSILDDLGLVAALQWLLKRQSQRAGFEGHLVAPVVEGRLPATIETCCFRLAQEALNNVTRHAGARRVVIELRHDRSAIELVIRDDGKGFDVRAARENAVQGASLGLLSMEERVSLAGGTLDIDSKRGRGTRIRARFPVCVDEAS